MISTDYFELRIKINPEMEEIVSELCFEYFECEGVVFAEEIYKDDLVLVSTTQGTLKAYLKSIDKVKEVLQEQRQLFLDRGLSEDELGSWDFEILEVENQDWSKKWKENWTVTSVTDKLSVVPTWIDYQAKEGEITIDLDPGSAFGTGTHPTTQLCMMAMEKYLNKNSKVADIGMGSGILAICAVKLGAISAYGCDNDELVIETAIENAELNNVSEQCHFEHNTADKILDKYDFVCANILHNILAEIMSDLKSLMKDGAKMVLSGILDEKKQVVLDAIDKHGLTLIEETHQDIWVGFVVKK